MSHLILWKKLVSCGVGSRFLDTIQSMYSKVKSCVRSDNGLTKLFFYTRGLRQGCLLSPILFAMLLNDLNEFLLEKASGVRIWDEQICAMLHADDLILIAESENDLRIQMNQLALCILKSCKNGSEPEENKSGDIFQNKKRNRKKR